MASTKPRILIFIDWYLPGYKAGGPITSNANMVAQLKNRFDFYILTRDTDYCENTPYPDVLSDTWNEADKNVHVYYFSQDRINYRNLKRVVQSLDFDIAYINGVYSRFFSFLPIFLTKQKKRIISSRGMISAHSLSIKSWKKRWFFKIARYTNLYKDIVFHITTEEEERYIKKLLGNRIQTFLAPNLPKATVNTYLRQAAKPQGALRLTSIARIAPEKNTLLAIELLSKCTTGTISFDLHGSVYDARYWEECQRMIAQLPTNVCVTYRGSVTGAELQQAYERSHFLFLPTRGENFGHSILESLSYGCPVIISDCTPWLRLQEKGIGWDIPLADEQKFVQVIGQCAAMGEEEYNVMSRRAFDYAQAYVYNPELIEQNIKLFES